jgi:hypothetical protein
MASPFDSQYDAIRQKIINKALEYGLDPLIAVWQLWQENKFKSSGCSGAGACGIAQFIPGTADQWGVDPSDVDSSLDGWGEYMDHLASLFNNDYRLMLAGYNAGEGNVTKYGGVPPFPETQNYVNVIMSNAAAQPVPVSGAVMAASMTLPSVDYTGDGAGSSYVGYADYGGSSYPTNGSIGALPVTQTSGAGGASSSGLLLPLLALAVVYFLFAD